MLKGKEDEIYEREKKKPKTGKNIIYLYPSYLFANNKYVTELHISNNKQQIFGWKRTPHKLEPLSLSHEIINKMDFFLFVFGRTYWQDQNPKAKWIEAFVY